MQAGVWTTDNNLVRQLVSNKMHYCQLEFSAYRKSRMHAFFWRWRNTICFRFTLACGGNLPAPAAVTKLFTAELSKALLLDIKKDAGWLSWTSPSSQRTSISICKGLLIALDRGHVDERPHKPHEWFQTIYIDAWLYWQYNSTKREPRRVKWLLYSMRMPFCR